MFLKDLQYLLVLRLERGGEHVILASCTKTIISLLIYKMS